MRKQKKLLTEVILPQSFKHTLLSPSDIDKEIIVVDGGDDGNPPIRPPEGLTWRLLSVREGIYIHVQDDRIHYVVSLPAMLTVCYLLLGCLNDNH